MKATFNPSAKTKFVTSHRKEKAGLYQEYAALVPSSMTGEARAIVTLRLYWPASVCYAALWVSAPGGHPDTKEHLSTSGTGQAGGGGCCKASAAAGEAISNAGFTLSEDIHGRGTSAIREAVLAIAAAVGYPEAMLHVAHA